jgi:phospholipid N-methyltransferase
VHFGEWLRRPGQIGAIAPSSRQLGNAMARWLPTNPDDLVVELGPGTGAITEALLAHGLHADRLLAIEKSPEMAGALRARFPAIKVVEGDALDLPTLVSAHSGVHSGVPQQVGAVISSLPLRQFSEKFTRALAGKILGLLRPGGWWVQYSYHLGTHRQHGSEQFHLLGSKIVWLNLPPARVCVYQKLAA